MLFFFRFCFPRCEFLQQLCDIGFWNDVRFFRVIPGFIVQFGINGEPSVQSKWRSANIGDDPVRVSNARGTVVFATAGPNSRTTQIFINTRAQGNDFLDKQGFSPIGKVIEGMEYVDQLYAGYGEGAPSGKGPNQARIQLQGNSYLKESYPQLSYVESYK
jgi:peptidyl-prolyl cis-trans isomerase A (cyclophilin A)